MTFYTYGHYTESGALFYIGKGQGSRCNDRTSRNKHWKHVVAKHGLKVEIFSKWETEQEAFDHERFLISCFRDDLKFKLCNCTDGGEGSSGFIMSEETKGKISKATSDAWKNPDFIEKMKTRAPGSFTEKKRVSSLQNAEKARKALNDPSQKEVAAKKNSDLSLNMWSDPEFKQRMKDTHKSAWTEDRKALMSAQTAGRVRMTDGVIEKNVLPGNVESLLAQGWIRGRGPNSPSKRSKS